MIVAVKADGVDLQEMDISHLQPGDSETIFTESGKTIDLLRTEDDVEIYIDGEQLDVGSLHQGNHGNAHVVHEQIEIICDDQENCEELTWAADSDDDSADASGQPHAVHEVEKVYIVKKKVDSN